MLLNLNKDYPQIKGAREGIRHLKRGFIKLVDGEHKMADSCLGWWELV